MQRFTSSVHVSLRPSTETKKRLLREVTCRQTTTLSVSTIGLTVREWGATGVRPRVEQPGCMIGPPTDKA